MRSIEIWSSPELWGGTLGGIIRLEPGASCEEEAADLAVLVFVWSADVLEPGSVRGWQPLSRQPYPVAADCTWTVRVPPAPQYAVSLVFPGFILGPDPEEPDGDGIDVVAPGTLLDPNEYPTVITPLRKNQLQILSAPDDDLTGAVLGVACGMYAFDRLHRNRNVPDFERLRLVAWAIDTDGKARPIGETRCELGGYWAFPPLDAAAKEAARYAVALVTNTYVAGPAVPEAAPDTEVMAVAYREHTQRPPYPPSPRPPPSSQRARAAGRGLKLLRPGDPKAPR